MSLVEPTRTLRYADHADGLIDVHEPDGVPAAMVVLLHGGFWKTAYDRTHTRPMAEALAEQGLLVVTPEYRRVGPGGEGGWPATGEDVARALRTLPELGFLYGAARGVLVVAVALLFFNWLVGSNAPAWIAQAKSRPMLESIGQAIENLLPDDPENSILKRLSPDEPEEEPAPDAPGEGAPAEGAPAEGSPG